MPNARSIKHKLQDLSNLLNFQCPQYVLVSETWEKPGMADSIEKFSEEESFTWIAKPRTSGGGSGVGILSDNKYSVTVPLKINVPNELEIVWAISSPLDRPELKIILAAFYSSTNVEYRPPDDMLQTHIHDTISNLSSKYPDAVYLLGGDAN